MSAFLSGLLVGASDKATQIIDEERRRAALREENIAAEATKRRNDLERITHQAQLEYTRQSQLQAERGAMDAEKIAQIQAKKKDLAGKYMSGQVNDMDLYGVFKPEEIRDLRQFSYQNNPKRIIEDVNSLSNTFAQLDLPEDVRIPLAIQKVLKVNSEEATKAAITLAPALRAKRQEELSTASVAFEEYGSALAQIARGALDEPSKLAMAVEGSEIRRIPIIGPIIADNTALAIAKWGGDPKLSPEERLDRTRQLKSTLIAMIPSTLSIIQNGDRRTSDQDIKFVNSIAGIVNDDRAFSELMTNTKQLASNIQQLQEKTLKHLAYIESQLGPNDQARRGITPNTMKAINAYRDKINGVSSVEASSPTYLKPLESYRANKDRESLKQLLNSLQSDKANGRISSTEYDRIVESYGFSKLLKKD